MAVGPMIRRRDTLGRNRIRHGAPGAAAVCRGTEPQHSRSAVVGHSADRRCRGPLPPSTLPGLHLSRYRKRPGAARLWLTWAGARDFDGRKVLPSWFSSRRWFGCSPASPAFEGNADLRVMVVCAITAMLAAATAEELWRGRAGRCLPLAHGRPLAYAAVLLAQIPATFSRCSTTAHC